MIVVIDSNQFYGDPLMTGREFGIILGQHDRGELQLAIPEVVVREIPKLFREQYVASRDKQAGGAQNLEKLGHSVPAASLPDADAATASFVQQLLAQMANARIDMPTLPNVSISDLVDDSIAERRPWQAKSRGFRDALIWRNVIDLAFGDDVILISKNGDDFAVSNKQPTVLHPHLQADVDALGHGSDRVRLAPTLEDFITEFVPVADQALLAARDRLATDQTFEQSLYSDVEHALYRFDFSLGDDVTIVESANASLEQVNVDDVSVSEVEITSAYDSDNESTAFIEIVAHAVMYFGFVTDISSAEWLIDERADIEIEVWESSFAQGRTHARYLKVTFWADFDPETGELGELEQASAGDDAVPPREFGGGGLRGQ